MRSQTAAARPSNRPSSKSAPGLSRVLRTSDKASLTFTQTSCIAANKPHSGACLVSLMQAARQRCAA
ncbi:MAG: hypothetical protein E7082_06720 [Bacteroidales bacterium]|nr:hypothetical protein [Bacteroidales bacterium]